ncbi:DUF2937 family protein [Marinagarivorans algicola]|uniref:DUF2937 family protein n=1 Tax=Marinagarivorans algicola TaxID=1513270 RepID=UPI0006B970F3|nr:DUF2937 family protein [Marinagarivorans algicola]
MISSIIDKLIFGMVLIVLMQLPLLADHYLQYLQGYFDATQKEVARDQALAKQYNYPTVYALIAAHKQSDIASVQADAERKSLRIQELAELQHGILLFTDGTLADKLVYMLTPKHSKTLATVTQNFKPGIPLHPQYLIFCTFFALMFNIIGAMPIKLVRYVKHKRSGHNARIEH